MKFSYRLSWICIQTACAKKLRPDIRTRPGWLMVRAATAFGSRQTVAKGKSGYYSYSLKMAVERPHMIGSPGFSPCEFISWTHHCMPVHGCPSYEPRLWFQLLRFSWQSMHVDFTIDSREQFSTIYDFTLSLLIPPSHVVLAPGWLQLWNTR